MTPRDFPDPHVPNALPGLPAALSDIPLLARSDDSSELGVIVFTVRPDTAFYRLSPESGRRLRLEIHDRLGAILRKSDRLYLIETWEWLFVLPGLRSSATLTLAMLRFGQLFEVSPRVDGISLRVQSCCGAAIYAGDGEDPLHLVQSARIARLYVEQNNLSSAIYEPEMEVFDERLRKLEEELRTAFSRDSGLQLFLQPQVEAESGRCVGAEALLRWRRDDGEWVPPGEALAAIERFGLRQRFNRWLFISAARICSKLEESGIGSRLSINISANDLLDAEVPDLLAQTLDAWGVPAARLRVEITETNMVEESGDVREVLSRLRGLGVSLSIDDFGTGFSGMSNLKSLPVDEVKIDRSFVHNLVGSQRDREITASILELSHRLGLSVVAEGVETRETADLLAEMGCDWLQGYHFAKPLPFDDFVAWHRKRHPLPDRE